MRRLALVVGIAVGLLRAAFPYYPLLPLGALIALVWANRAGDSYFRVAQALAFPVNDIGATFGLASLAQEVREATGSGGLLSSWRRVWLLIALGVGGVVAAAATYTVYIRLANEQILLRGWPIVCGVDVFVSVAVARTIFRRGSTVTMVVLLALVSDVVALLAISRRPFAAMTQPAAFGLVVLALAVSALFQRRGVHSIWPHLLVAGPLAWFGCYWSGLHPALALLPIVPFFPTGPRTFDDFSAHRHEHASLAYFESALAYPLQAVAFLFGLANAGVLWRGFDTGTWAVAACVAGRPAGILLTAGVAALLGLAPQRYLCWPDLIVVALIGSVGSIFALFLSTAVFPDGPLLTEAKIGAIATVAGVPVAFMAARTLRVGRFARGGA